MYVGVELGGTKIVVAHGTSPDDVSALHRIPTREPQPTLEAVFVHIRELEKRHGEVRGVGIASFGPIGVNPDALGYGVMRRTPKPGWSHFDVVGPFRAAFPNIPMAIDTDVTAAAFAERRWGAGNGKGNLAYVTAGTGIGAGILVDGVPVHGALHPEVGHIVVRRDPRDLDYRGRCPFHDDCLEGLACGPSILDRTGRSGEDLPGDHPIWSIIGGYLGQLFYTLTLAASPERIVVGGSLGLREDVLEASRDRLLQLLGGYISEYERREAIDPYVVKAELGDRAGVLGAIALVAV